MNKSLIEETAETVAFGNLYNQIEVPLKALVEAQRLWMDCAHDVLHAEMDALHAKSNNPLAQEGENSLAGPASNRMRMHMMLARAQYERALGRFRAIADDLDRRHGMQSQRWCSEMLDLLEPKASWPSMPSGFNRQVDSF